MNKAKEERVYRWKDDASGMEYKCPECGNWRDMDDASIVSFGDRPACNDCFSVIQQLVGVSA